MQEEFHRLEESLKTFLSEEQSDKNTSFSANYHKYNNLKIYMDPSKSKIPHLIIRLGISEAMYDLEKFEKMSGGLGMDEKVVRRWLQRTLGRSDLDLSSAWKLSIKPKVVSIVQEPDD